MSSTTSLERSRTWQLWASVGAGYLLPAVVAGLGSVLGGGSVALALPQVLFMALLSPVGWVMGLVMDTWPGSWVRPLLAAALLLALGLIWLGWRVESPRLRCGLMGLGAAILGLFGMMGFGPA